MVQVSIYVRPTSGYHYPNKVDRLLIDSSDRLETIQEKYSTSGTTRTRLYHGNHELPPNSSIGSHNFDDGIILECCRSPSMSAALSACLKDLENIKRLSEGERNVENLMNILQTPEDVRDDRNHEMWTNWNNDKLKTRQINLATMKSALQRQDRYQVHDLPKCDDCQSLYVALEKHGVWTGGTAGGNDDGTTPTNGNGRRRVAFNQKSHIFKPIKKDGEPTTNWILVEEKLRIQSNIRREFESLSGMPPRHYAPGYDSPPIDWLEEFVRRDDARHCAAGRRGNSIGRDDSAALANTPPPRRRMSHSRANGSRPNNSRALSNAGAASSPARSKGSRSNHAALHEGAATSSLPRSGSYIPQYASGPFAVLATLHLAMHSRHRHSKGRRLLTLTEDQLKRMAQPMCRSNLYDKGRIRGRNAFACMDGLMEKHLVRKEIVRNAEGDGGDEIEKWGLLQDAESLAEKCADFDRAVNDAIPLRNVNVSHLKSNANLLLCLDTREDVHLIERMKMSCEDENVPYVERELPAGDYLFIDQSSPQEYVLPLLVERKSWSDLADSCLGKGRALNRLDCVKLGSTSGCSGNCQLCKMKRCGCGRVMFIIEGERCLGSDSVHRTAKQCTKEKCCSACRLLCERHDVTQDVLEGVLNRLQIEHGCFIHYTKSYNETISSLFDMRTLLQSESNSGGRLSFESYASNARRKSSTCMNQVQPRPTRVQDLNVEMMVNLVGSGEWDLNLIRRICVEMPDQGLDKQPSRKKSKISDDLIIELSDSDDDDFSFGLDPADEGSDTKSRRGTSSCRLMNNETICLDSDSGDEIQLVTEIRGGGDTYSLSSDDDIDASSRQDVGARGGITNDIQGVNTDDIDIFSNLSRFNKDRRNSVAKSSHESSADDAISLGHGNEADEIELRVSNMSSPALMMIGKLSSKSSSIAKKLVYDIDDDSQDEPPHKARESSASASASPIRAPPSRNRTPSTVEIRKASEMNIARRNVNLHNSGTVYPLFVVHGWDNYDRQFYHHLEKIWKEIYSKSCDNDQIIDLLNARIQESEFTFVRRRTFMRFTLWMQLAGVQIRSVQRMRFADEIRSFFCESEKSPGGMISLPYSPNPSVPAPTIPGPHSTPVPSSTQKNVRRDRIRKSGALPCKKMYPTSSNKKIDAVREACLESFPASTIPGPHSTPVPSSTQQNVGRGRIRQSGAMPDEKMFPASSNKEIDAVREARLKRFEKNPTDCPEKNPNTWSCQRCTLENNLADKICAMCASCSRCTFQNAEGGDVCSACDTPRATSSGMTAMAVSSIQSSYRPDQPRSSHVSTSWIEPATSMDTKAANKRVSRCGACGHEDHTRANATESNCPAYFDEKEVDRREKIRRKREETLASEQAQIRAMEQEGANAEKRQAELMRIHEELKRDNERTEAFRKEELKRRKQKVQRLQKRQNNGT